MNQIAWQIFGGTKAKANTFIGGVASTITTSGALATRLGIASNRITNFKIVGSDIECLISGSYVIPFRCFYQNTNITSYNDKDGLVTSTALQSFYRATNLVYVEFKNLNTIGYQSFDGDGVIMALRSVYTPLCTSLGGSVGYDFVFRSCYNLKLYCSSTLATNNAGAPDGDISSVSSQSIIARYVTNFTAPNQITNLSVGNVYGTAVQLNFTAPIGSTNAIDYYEVWQNGVNTGKTVTASGQYITGLTLNTAYTFQLIPVDIFYNKSTSNVVSVTTMASELYPVSNIVSYYKMENNVLDSWGTNNGTATAITYASGLVGQTAVFNGTTSNIIVPDSNNLSFGNGTNDSPFSVSFILNLNSTSNQVLINKLGGSTATDEYFIAYWSNKLSVSLKSGNNNALSLDCNTASGLSTGVNHIITITYDGSKTANGIKVYFNNVLQSSTNTIVGAYVAMNNKTADVRIGRAGWTASNFLNGKMDEVSIWNAELTALQITEINAKLNTGQSLI